MITTGNILTFHDGMCDRARNTMEAKNADYGDRDSKDAFANFRADGLYGIIVRMSDKVSRLRTFAKGHTLAVKSESAEDCALDLINYAVLFLGYLRNEREAQGKAPMNESRPPAIRPRKEKRAKPTKKVPALLHPKQPVQR